MLINMTYATCEQEFMIVKLHALRSFVPEHDYLNMTN